MDGYNRTRFVEALLERHQSEPPSFSIHLYPENWTINSGAKFLYNDFRYSAFLDEVRAHRIPADYIESFQESGVRYFDGCLIVDLFDYRPQKPTDPALENPEKTREVLHPNSETLWADLCLVNVNSGGNLTDTQALEMEARILLATSAPLCLDPNPHLTRIANNVLRISTPAVPASLKRKASALNVQKDESEKARKEKIMQFMAPTPRASRQFRQLDVRERFREEQRRAAAIPPPQPPSRAPSQPRAPSHTPVPTSQAPAFVSNQSSNHSSPVAPPSTSQYVQAHSPPGRPVAFVPNRVNGVQTPVSSNSHHSPSPQPHYPHVQTISEVSVNRTPTPAQRFSQSPRVQHIQPHSVPQNPGAQSHASPPGVQPQQLPAAARASPRPPSTHPQIQMQQQQHVPIQQQLPQPAQLPQQLQPSTSRQTATPVQTFQPPVPAVNFLQHPPTRGRRPSAAGQTVDAVTTHAQLQAYNAHYQQQHTNRLQQMVQAAQPPQPQPMAVAQGGVARASPMTTNARLATRSPMPSSLSQNGNGNNATANTAAANSPRPRTTALTGTAPTGGVNSPRLLPQNHQVPAAQSLLFRPMHTGAAQAQAQAQTQQHSPSASVIPIHSVGEDAQSQGQVHVSQQRPLQPVQTPKMQQQQLGAQQQQQQQQHQQQQQQQQQRRTTPSQAPTVQQQQPHSQAQLQPQPYQMYAAYPQQTGYPAGQIPPQYYVRGVQPGTQLSTQQIRQLQHLHAQQQHQYALAQQAQAQQAQQKAQGR
ncbi:hypothetical protein BT96DRAFT_925879 [Gymnopus androsaceus JB14]|uniref:Spt20-like SEP domain-containing protein n=1 Tax=Gymnopus androsaceus JB14 TaxID=1447944 RepID=A0A6A4GXF3_9AGAR|nr:hypothetical protein BT96DRAFT_925879 [Gymnopus androsaceus JB14]